MNPRELVACAESAMMTAKARGQEPERPLRRHRRPSAQSVNGREDVRSIAHLKMLQSLAGRLNRLNDVREIGSVIVNELRGLIDYHNCRVYIADGDTLFPIAFKGTSADTRRRAPRISLRVRRGLTGLRSPRPAARSYPPTPWTASSRSTIPGTEDIDESVVAVPLKYGSRVSGVVVISKLGVDQFDEDDVRLLEVLAGHAAVAFENARLYEARAQGS